MSVLILLACVGDRIDSAADSASPDSEAPDLAPTLSAEVQGLGASVGSELVLELLVEDEDPDSVELSLSLGEELATGSFDGSTWTGTASSPGLTTMTVTATDAAGQSASLELPLEVWTGRAWTGFMPLQSPDNDIPSPCIGMSRDGWTYVAGWAGTVGLMVGVDAAGGGWMQIFDESLEYGRCGAVDESNGQVLYVGERSASLGGVLRSVDAEGVVWEAQAPWTETTSYWVDARDGLVAAAGTYVDYGANERGGWVQLYEGATGEAQGEPILLGAHDALLRTEPSSVQLLEDGSVLTGSWGYWDWEAEASSVNRSGWVQRSSPGDAVNEPLVVVAAEGADVYLADALQLADGRIAVVGETSGELVQPLQGHTEGFLMVYEADGSLAWGYQQASTSSGRFLNLAEGRDGRIYVLADAGYFQDELSVLSFGPEGSLAWETVVVAGGKVSGRGVAVMGEDLVVTGMFEGDLAEPPIPSGGGVDGFVVRLDTDGDLKL